MIEILQANAGGRYVHEYDQHDSPRDPNFTGAGRVITDAEGRYRFITIKPGAYPGTMRAMRGVLRTSTIRCWARALLSVSSRRCIFPAIRCSRSMPSPMRCPKQRGKTRRAFRSRNDRAVLGLSYRFDFVLRGRDATPMEH